MEEKINSQLQFRLEDILPKFGEEMRAKIMHSVELLKKAEVYVQRIDWLLSGDDSEETSLRRLREDLKDQHDNNRQ